MNFWKHWPYPAKMALAFFLFFLVTLGFALFRAKGSHPKHAVESFATTEAERSSWQHKPTVLYFWATWCTVCKVYSNILETNLKLLNENTIFLSVVEDEKSEELTQYISSHKIQYPVLSASYETLRDWGISAFPTTVFLNAKGELVFVDTGIISPVGFWLRSFLLQVL